jgi:hypothetical protein
MINGEFALILSTAMLTMLKLQIILKVAKVEDTAGPRHQGRSCSRLPQGLDNEGDAVSSAFLKGKQHSKKAVFIGCHQRLDLMIVTPINAKPLSKPFNV